MIDDKLVWRISTEKQFDAVTANLEAQTEEHGFRVLAVHDVQKTVAEKGFERGPLKIIEVCNAKFAHTATQIEVEIAVFMPCRFAVYTEASQTVVVLMRPMVMSQMLPQAGIDDLAADVEKTLISIAKESV